MSAIPDLTPPGKSGKSDKPKTPKVVNTDGTEAKTEKVAKAPKAEKAPVDPNAPKAPRAARQDYGFRPDAVIAIVKDKDVTKLRGHRKAWHDKIAAFDGKKVSEFTEANKTDVKDPPRGWVRFFAQEGFISLIGGTQVPDKKPAEPTPTETPPTA